jgi:HPt (histidine-containing phosphotransfer) domain-containing protein
MNFIELAENLGLEEDEFRELVELFIETGTADFKKIETAMAERDADQVMRSAHTIKGAAGNLGFMEISDLANLIEENAGNNTLEGLDQAVSSLRSHFESITAFVTG